MCCARRRRRRRAAGRGSAPPLARTDLAATSTDRPISSIGSSGPIREAGGVACRPRRRGRGAALHRELVDAVAVLEPHVDAALREGLLAICTFGEVELARVESVGGRTDEAIERRLRARRDRVARGTPRFLSTLLDVAECRLRLQVGDLDRAADLIAAVSEGPERTLLIARSEPTCGTPPPASWTRARHPGRARSTGWSNR